LKDAKELTGKLDIAALVEQAIVPAPQTVDVEITGMKVRASRTLPVYREDGTAVSYTSDVSDHEIVVGCSLPMALVLPAGLSDKETVLEVMQVLSDMVSEKVALCAEVKALSGAKLPVKVDYALNGRKVEGI
jgi:hypothetical protein